MLAIRTFLLTAAALIIAGLSAGLSLASITVPWATQAGGTLDDIGRGVSTLADGSSIVTGFFSGTATFGSTTLTSAGGFDVFVAKVDASGAYAWATQAGGTSADVSYGVSTLADGSSIVTGEFNATATFGSTTLTSAGSADVFVAKVDASGAYVWATQAGGTSTDIGYGVSTLADGSSIVTGRFSGTATFGSTTLISAGGNDVFVAKLASTPGAPTSVTATAGDAQATVSWTTPSSDGGSAITSYIATASPGGATCTVSAPSTSCTITGLANGTAYTFTVVATNGAGNSVASAASAAVSPQPSTPPTPTPAPPSTQAPTSALVPAVLPQRTRLTSGQTMRLGVRTRNTGRVAATGVTSCLRLPANLVVVRKGSALRSGRTVCFRQGTIAAGSQKTGVILVRAVSTRRVSARVTGTARHAGTATSRAATNRIVRIQPRDPRVPVVG